MARLANLFDPFASLNCKQLSGRPSTLDLHFKSTTGIDSDSVPAAAKTKGAEEVDGEALIAVELSAGELIGGTGSVSIEAE
ncbi:hypothetical protein IGI04_008940 [Brassica rapa subsp. trilocularis]|uniref:Uncharacterized protein n=1 Tax=Brassica rapa subsp. trilocularis TaxID=1813537 RepID=A0ABQ7MYA1_BRACM|nr:hypothetical protein IGI04_008940 [Brassica rapa subsp. trilocularis]